MVAPAETESPEDELIELLSCHRDDSWTNIYSISFYRWNIYIL